MAATTPDLMYQGILARIKAAGSASDFVDDDFIYISPQPQFTQEDDQFVQVIPGVPQSITSEAGYFLLEEDFEVVAWSRSYLDQGRQSTERYANLTYGILALMSKVRSQLLNHIISITNDGTDHMAVLPITYARGSRLFESDEYPGWCYLSDTYQFGYEIA